MTAMTALGWLDRVFRGKGKKEVLRRQRKDGIVSLNGGHDPAVNRRTTNGEDPAVAAPDEEPALTEEELSGLDNRDREMLRSIIELDYTTVREVMVPRLDMVSMEASVSLKEAAAAIVQHGHSRLPVYVETIDEILGILYVRDLLAAIANPEEGRDLRSLTRPAFVVPETKRVDTLMEEFRQRRTQIAVVVDEYGGTEGLVTMEDVLEEIVGEIEDEFSRVREAEIYRQEDGSVFVNSGLGTEEVEDRFRYDWWIRLSRTGPDSQSGRRGGEGRVTGGSGIGCGEETAQAEAQQRGRQRGGKFRVDDLAMRVRALSDD